MHEFEVELATADGTLDSFVCHPEEDGPHPAIVMYMDAPGIREELRDMARRIAATGYFVMLPNLYYRAGREGTYPFDRTKIPGDDGEREKMFAVMNTLTNARVVADTGPMIAFLSGHEAAAEGGIGCVGYCMSGQFVVAAGAAYPDDFTAIASYYGVRIKTEEEDSPHLEFARVKGEMYLAFASHDPHVPQEIVDALPAALDAAGCNARVEVYPETEHGFAFPSRAVYVRPAAERHWERMLALFDRRLRR